MPGRHYQFRWAFSTSQQAAYGTPVIDGSLDKSGFIKGPDLADRVPRLIRDNSQFGRGDEFSHGQEVEAWDLSLARNFDLTTLMAGLFTSFGLGSVATTQPAAGTDPAVYDHAITPQNAATSVQLPQMTIIEEALDLTGIKKKIQDLVINDFEISGSGVDRLQIKAGLKGSGQWANSVLAMPVITAAKFLRMKDVKFELGLFGAGLTDMSSRLKSFSFKWDNKLLDDDGYFPGSGLFRGRHEFSERELSLEFDLLVETDGQELDRLDSNTNLAIKITAAGETLPGASAFKHTVTIDMPDVHYRTVGRKYIDGKLAYGIAANVNYDDTGGNLFPVKITVRNDQPSYLV